MTSHVTGRRLTRTFVQRIQATPEEIFPLLCPVREKEWLAGWNYRMIHSRSGVAERGAVFETPSEEGSVVWVVTEYDPARRIAFVRWEPEGLVVQLEISLGKHHEAGTAVCIAYTYTAVNETGAAALARSGEEAWLGSMSFWETSMNAWFENKRRGERAARG